MLLGISLVPMAVAVERRGAFDSFSRSWELVRGNRLQLFLFHLVTGLFTLLGVCLLCVGVFITGPLAYTAQMEAYLRLVRSREEQRSWVVPNAR